MQKHALVLHDLVRYANPNNADYHSISEALTVTQTFLDEFNIIQTKSMFPVSTGTVWIWMLTSRFPGQG